MRAPWLLALLPVLALASDHDQARYLVERGEIQPLPVILEQARRATPGHVLEVELEREKRGWEYELKILDAQGRVREHRFDARTGAYLGEEED